MSNVDIILLVVEDIITITLLHPPSSYLDTAATTKSAMIRPVPNKKPKRIICSCPLAESSVSVALSARERHRIAHLSQQPRLLGQILGNQMPCECKLDSPLQSWDRHRGRLRSLG